MKYCRMSGSYPLCEGASLMRRTEAFHAATNMSTMDALPEVEIVATAARSKGLRLSPATMAMCRASPMATRLQEAGIS